MPGLRRSGRGDGPRLRERRRRRRLGAVHLAVPVAASRPDPDQADQPGEGRKLLLFSDSRQAAAFFAPYLETSYETIQHRG